MTYAKLVAEAKALENAQRPQAGPERLLAAAERISTAWASAGWNGTAPEPERKTIPAHVYAAVVALYLQEEGYSPARAESLVSANHKFLIETRAEGAEPQAAAELAHLHLLDAAAQQPSRSRSRPTQAASRYR